jgi:hypothetical protein
MVTSFKPLFGSVLGRNTGRITWREESPLIDHEIIMYDNVIFLISLLPLVFVFGAY